MDLPSLVALPAVRDTVDGIARVLADNEAAGGPLIVPEAAYLSPYAMQCLGLPEPHPESRSPHLKARPSHVPPLQPLPPRTQGAVGPSPCDTFVKYRFLFSPVPLQHRGINYN